MNRDLVKDYLGKSGMDSDQAEGLSRILEDMERRLATKGDLAQVKEELAVMKGDLTWRMIAIVGFFGTIITLLNAYIA